MTVADLMTTNLDLATNQPGALILAPQADNARVTDIMRVTNIMQEVVQKKDEHIHEVLDTRWKGRNTVKEACIIGGDVTSSAFSVFQGVSCFVATSAAMTVTAGVCGVVGGTIMIGDGLVAGSLAIAEFKNARESGDYTQAIKLSLCCILEIGIGVMMILISLSILSAAFTLFACLAANPYTLPIIWLVLFLVIVGGLIKSEIRILSHEDLGSKMLLDEISAKLDNPDDLSALANQLIEQHLPHIRTKSSQEAADAMIKLTEKFSADIGVEAGQEMMKLLLILMRLRATQVVTEELTTQLTVQRQICDEKLKAFYRSVHVRCLQAVLYMSAFPIAVIAANVAKVANILNGVSDFSIGVPLQIGFYNDMFNPFRRTYALVAPAVERHTLQTLAATNGVPNGPAEVGAIANHLQPMIPQEQVD